MVRQLLACGSPLPLSSASFITRALLISLAASATTHASPTDALDPAGPNATSIANLFHLFLYITAAVYVLTLLATLLTLRKANTGDPTQHLESNPKVERTNTIVVSSCIGITAVILFVLMLADLTTGRALHATENNFLSVKIIGQQWWWQIQYQEGAHSNWLSSANELHLPTGRMIKFDLESHDVIHSFWFPNLTGKKDLIPGHPTTLFFKADRPGTYFGQCAEFCGLQHAHMRMTLVVEEPDKFQKWYSDSLKPAPDPQDDSQKRGKQVFLTTSCVLCHKISGTTAGASFGPELSHIASRRMIGAGTLTNEPVSLTSWISDPQQFKPGAKMPQNALPPEDLRNLVAYLTSLK